MDYNFRCRLQVEVEMEKRRVEKQVDLQKEKVLGVHLGLQVVLVPVLGHLKMVSRLHLLLVVAEMCQEQQ